MGGERPPSIILKGKINVNLGTSGWKRNKQQRGEERGGPNAEKKFHLLWGKRSRGGSQKEHNWEDHERGDASNNGK